MRKLLLILPFLLLGIIPVMQADAATVKLVLCYHDAVLCPNGNFTVAFNVVNGTVINQHLQGCADGQFQKWQASNSTWICSAGGSGLSSINGDSTAAQLISGVAGNTTASTSSGTTTINLGTNVLMTGGSSQTISKQLTINSGILGGDLNVGSNALTISGHKGTLPSNTGTFVYSNGTFSGTLSSLASSAITWSGHTFTLPSNTGTVCLANQTSTCGAAFADTDNFLTSINSDSTAAQTLTGQTGNITATTSAGTTTFKLDTNVAVLGNALQTFTKGITFSSGSILTMTPSSSTGTFNLGTLSAYPTSPRQGILIINGSNLSYNDNTNHTRSVVLLNTTQSILGVKSFTASNNTFTGGNNFFQRGSNSMGFTSQVADSSHLTRGLTIANPLDSFGIQLLASAQTHNQTATIPLLTSNDTFAFLGVSQTFSNKNTFSHAINLFAASSTGLTISNPAFTRSYTLAGAAITANQTLNLPLTTQTETLAVVPHYNRTTVTNQTGTGSTTWVMLKGFVTLTPTTSTNATISISGDAYTNNINAGCIIGIRTSSTYMGTNGGTLKGTPVGSTIQTMSATVNQNMTFAKTTVATGLSTGTKQFFDLMYASTTAGSMCKIHHLEWYVSERQ